MKNTLSLALIAAISATPALAQTPAANTAAMATGKVVVPGVTNTNMGTNVVGKVNAPAAANINKSTTPAPSATATATATTPAAGVSANVTTTTSTVPTTDTWNTENSYWSSNYSSRPYYNRNKNYTVYEPAYRFGVDLYARNSGRTFTDLNQADLSKEWQSVHGASNLDWSDAHLAVQDAYNRMYEQNNRAGVSANVSR